MWISTGALSAGPLLRHAVSFSWNNPSMPPLRDLTVSPTHPAHSYSSVKTQLRGHLPSPLKVPSSPTIQVGAPPLVSPWAPRRQILPTFPAARIVTSSMMCSQCLLTNGSVSDFLTDILGKGLRFYVVIRIRPQCSSA